MVPDSVTKWLAAESMRHFLETTWHRSEGTAELLPIEEFCRQLADQTPSYRGKGNGPDAKLTGREDRTDCGHNGTGMPGVVEN
jgi:hypothetical protein